MNPSPGQPGGYLSRVTLVSYYGSPLGPALGALGIYPRESMLNQLRGVADAYQPYVAEGQVLPTFHIITTVADAHPGPYGVYSHQLSRDVISEWITYAEAVGAAVVLDIQPGHASIQAEFDRIKDYLYRPHVHLAMDPEFIMEGTQIPGQQIGQIYPAHVNPIQEQLNGIAHEIGVNKVLILHQFADHMIVDKAGIANYPGVELVIDADGFGSPGAKIGDFLQYAGEPAFEYGGFKLFYDWDVPLLDPATVMGLQPRPVVIIYQ